MAGTGPSPICSRLLTSRTFWSPSPQRSVEAIEIQTVEAIELKTLGTSREPGQRPLSPLGGEQGCAVGCRGRSHAHSASVFVPFTRVSLKLLFSLASSRSRSSLSLLFSQGFQRESDLRSLSEAELRACGAEAGMRRGHLVRWARCFAPAGQDSAGGTVGASAEGRAAEGSAEGSAEGRAAEGSAETAEEGAARLPAPPAARGGSGCGGSPVAPPPRPGGSDGNGDEDEDVYRCDLGCGFVGAFAVVDAHEREACPRRPAAALAAASSLGPAEDRQAAGEDAAAGGGGSGGGVYSPKKQKAGYSEFVKQMRPLVKKLYPGMTAVEVGFELTAQWEKLSSAEKARYMRT